MNRTLIAVSLNALTLIGGHFYNRRWDRAVLFFVVFVFWGIGVYIAMSWSLSGSAHDVGAVSAAFSSHWKIFRNGAFLLWAIGLVVTFLDGRRAETAPSYRWTVSGVAGAVALSLLTGAFFLLQAVTFSFFAVDQASSIPPGRSESAAAFAFESPRLSQFVYFGTYPDIGLHPPKPPSGGGFLRGRFTYEGKPAPGVTLALVLNSKYETAPLTTDANGEFTVRLPEGEWVVNRLAVHSWAGLPEKGRFMIVTGSEPKLTGGEYDEHFWIDRKGMKVAVGDRVGGPQLKFSIRKRIVVTWPKAGPKPTPATLAKAAIAWDPYPDAQTYLVRTSEIRHESDTSTAYYPVTKRLTGTTRFALRNLAAVHGEKMKEYQATVYAFAKDGTLLSESAGNFHGATFVLTDKQQLVRDEERAFTSARLSAKQLQQIRANNRRVDAIEVLLDDGLVDDAEQLLGKINGAVDPGKKMAIAGYVMAKRGRCAEANKLFAKALSEGGNRCIPDYYHAACPE